MDNIIKLVHGDGGKYTNSLINNIFYKHFDNDLLLNSLDSAVFEIEAGRLAFTTDSFVVKPLVFPGGDIGKLSVCGTINDLSAAGAKPLYLSCGVIIEEGFNIDLLEKIAASMGSECRKAGVKIVTGDTKVVEKGFVEGVFINTAGIGLIQNEYKPKPIQNGDAIIITGGIAEHGITIALERYKIKVKGNLRSDCMPLSGMINILKNYMSSIKLMKDPTRGGVATALNEIAEISNMGVHLLEEAMPIREEVKSACELLGLDPLYLASEGRMLLVVDQKDSNSILEQIKQCKRCEDAKIIGSFFDNKTRPIVFLETFIGGKRIIGQLEGEMLPRIC